MIQDKVTLALTLFCLELQAMPGKVSCELMYKRENETDQCIHSMSLSLNV